jgi:5'-methylthioadenosine phosphorylase
MLAIIGGTGFTKLANLEIVRRQVMRTPYGEPSGALMFGQMLDMELVFLARHGYGHHLAPHEVNYRANIWAMKQAGADYVVAVNSVGGIHDSLVPGALVIPEQIIDYTWGRKSTFFEGAEQPVTHIDFTCPYDEGMRQSLVDAAASAGEEVIAGGVYACTQGPRLETVAEINRLERDGATMVGMTGMPEVALARELGLKYAALAVVANYAAGRGTSRQAIHLEDTYAVMEDGINRVHKILERLVVSDGH